jgi:uncharacterized membrane protein YraQ (UPF0718 family)
VDGICKLAAEIAMIHDALLFSTKLEVIALLAGFLGFKAAHYWGYKYRGWIYNTAIVIGLILAFIIIGVVAGLAADKYPASREHTGKAKPEISDEALEAAAKVLASQQRDEDKVQPLYPSFEAEKLKQNPVRAVSDDKGSAGQAQQSSRLVSKVLGWTLIGSVIGIVMGMRRKRRKIRASHAVQ